MLDGGLRVELNGFRFYGVDDTGCEWLANSVDGGWNGAGTSHEHSSRAWGDGWVSNASHRQGRNLTVSGSVWAPDQQALDASRQRMLGSVPMDDGELTVELDGVSRLWRVKQDSGEVLISRRGPHIWDFSIPLVSLSPYSFDAGDPLFGSTGLAATSGGMRFPSAFTGLAPDASTSWQGAVDGSASLLSGGGGVLKNWMRDPKPYDASAFEGRWSGGVSVGEEGLHVTPGSHRIGWNWMANPDHALASSPPAGAVLLPAGSYVVSWRWRLNQATASLATAHVESSDGGSWMADHAPAGAGVWTDFMIPVTLGSQAWLAVSDQVYDDAFGSGSSGGWRCFGIFSQSDWALMQAQGISWFDGDSFSDPVSSWSFSEATVAGAVALTNPGGAPSPVTLRVDGPVDGPRIEHQPSGSVLELSLSLGAGHYVLFDSQSRQVLIDGRDPARGAVLRRGWSDALPGANTWSFTAKGSSPGARLTVSFRPAYL